MPPLKLEEARAQLGVEERAAALAKLKALQDQRAPASNYASSVVSQISNDARSVSSRTSTQAYTYAPSTSVKENSMPVASATLKLPQTTMKERGSNGEDVQSVAPRNMQQAVSAVSVGRQEITTPTQEGIIMASPYSAEQLAEARRVHDEVTRRGGGNKPSFAKPMSRPVTIRAPVHPAVAPMAKPATKAAGPSPAKSAAARGPGPSRSPLKVPPVSSATKVTVAASQTSAAAAKHESAPTQAIGSGGGIVAISSAAPNPDTAITKTPGAATTSKGQSQATVPVTPRLQASQSNLPPTPPSISRHLTKAMKDLSISDSKPIHAVANPKQTILSMVPDTEVKGMSGGISNGKTDGEAGAKMHNVGKQTGSLTSAMSVNGTASTATTGVDPRPSPCNVDNTVRKVAGDIALPDTKEMNAGAQVTIGKPIKQAVQNCTKQFGKDLSLTSGGPVQPVTNGDIKTLQMTDQSHDCGCKITTKHLKETIAKLQAQIAVLLDRIIDLEQQAEIHKFVGTKSAKTPFMVAIVYPDGEIMRVQTFGEMRVNTLLERIIRAKRIDGGQIVNTTLKHGAVELGHLALVGEYDLYEGHELVFTYERA